MRLPPGSDGTIVDVKVFNRYGIEKDDRALAIEREEIEKLADDREAELGILNRNTKTRLITLIDGKSVISSPEDIEKKSTFNKSDLENSKLDSIWKIELQKDNDIEQISNLRKQYEVTRTNIQSTFDNLSLIHI